MFGHIAVDWEVGLFVAVQNQADFPVGIAKAGFLEDIDLVDYPVEFFLANLVEIVLEGPVETVLEDPVPGVESHPLLGTQHLVKENSENLILFEISIPECLKFHT